MALIEDRRIMASRVPSTTPPAIDSAVTCSVKARPWKISTCQVRAMTSKSKFSYMVLPGTPTDVTRHCDPALNTVHRQHDDAVDCQVDHRGGGKGLKHLEAEFLHRARPSGQLHQPDRS